MFIHDMYREPGYDEFYIEVQPYPADGLSDIGWYNFI